MNTSRNRSDAWGASSVRGNATFVGVDEVEEGLDVGAAREAAFLEAFD